VHGAIEERKQVLRPGIREFRASIAALLIGAAVLPSQVAAAEPAGTDGAKQPPASGGADPSLDDILSGSPPPPAAPAGSSAPSAPAPAAQAPADSGVIPAAPAQPATAGPAPGGSGLPLAAEPAEQGKAESHSHNRTIEEIIVTAQKREENIQDVPLTVQAFSGDMLDAKGVLDAKSLPSITPSMNYSEFVGYSVIYMRGVGTSAFLTADPSIATYVDGVFLPFASGLASDFGSIDRIEVLKGPQGTLFGRSAVGGALSIYTTDPKFDEYSLHATESYGSFGDVVAKGTLNIPIGSSFALAVSGNYHTDQFYYRGSYGESQFALNTPFGSETTKGMRLKAHWQPFDNIDFVAAYAHNSFDGYGTSVMPVYKPSPLGMLLGEQAQGNYYADLNHAGLQFFSDLGYGHLTFKPGPVDIKLSGSYQYTGNAQEFDFDGSPVPIAYFADTSPKDQGSRTVTSELQFTSNADTPFSSFLSWVAGGYFLNSQAGFRRPAFLFVDALAPLQTLESVAGGLPLVNFLTQNAPNGEVGFSSGVATNSLAGYLQGTLKFTDWLSLTAGARYTLEKRTANLSGTYVGEANGSFVELIDRPHESHTTISKCPKISLELRPRDNMLFYGSFQTAEKAGTYNAVQIYAPSVVYVVPELITAYELGTKNQFFDGALTFDAAVWYYVQRNLQTQFISLLEGGVVSFATAPKAHSKGGEVTATWAVLPDRIEGLAISASGAYVDSRYKDYTNGPGFDQTTGVFSGNLNFTGNYQPQSAKYTGTLGINKVTSWDRIQGSLEFGADLYYTSSFFWDSQNSPNSEQRGYLKLGLQLSYFNEPHNLRVTGYVQNATDARYDTQQLTTDFGVLRNQALGRVIGVRLEEKF
jgi:iron complex outermembrane receptor protein